MKNKRRRLNSDEINEIVEQVDEDGDGQISYDEFVHAVYGDMGREKKKKKKKKKKAVVDDNNNNDGNNNEDDTKQSTGSDDGTTNKTFFKVSSFIRHRMGKLTDHYTVDECVAKGTCGVVCSATHKETGTAQCLREVNILKDSDHPNILKMYEPFEEKKHYYIVTEFCDGGDLCQELPMEENAGRIKDEQNAVMLIKELLIVVSYCHKNKIVHRDLKPSNALLEKGKTAKPN